MSRPPVHEGTGDILDVLEPSVLAVVQRWEVELRWVDARKVHPRSQGRCAGRVHPTGEGPDQREFPGVAARLVGELRAASPLAASPVDDVKRDFIKPEVT